MFARLTSTFVTLIACAAAANAALNFGGGQWIWASDAVPGQAVNFPIETRAFRKDINTGLKFPTFVEIIMVVGDAFTLFVNGKEVGTGEWPTPEYFCVPVSSNSTCYIYNKVVLALSASNTIENTLAGVLATVQVHYSDGSSDRFVTDNSWLSSMTVPSGFQDPNFNDRSWTPAVEQVAYEDAFSNYIPLPPSNQICQ